MITIIQVLMILFALFAWSRAALRLRDKDIPIGEFIFWSVIWVGVITFAILPGFLGNISTILGIGRATDLAIYISIVVLFYMVFRIYVKVDGQSQEITKLVREISFKRKKK
jgi:hypothetical protein